MRTASSSLGSASFALLPVQREVTVVYPDEFEGAQFLLVPGPYLVEWRRRSLLTVAVSALTGDPVIVRDTWTLGPTRSGTP